MNRLLLPLAALTLIAFLAAVDAGEPAVKPINLEKLNTTADEDDPFLTPDGQYLYYASNSAGTFDIYYAKKGAKEPFGAGSLAQTVSTAEADERSPFVARDGAFYFASNAVPDPSFKDLKNYDLKKKTGTQAALPLPGVSEKDDELHPWITAGGKEFYFSRKTKEGWILMLAQGPTPGPIGKAAPVGFGPGFHHATLNSSGLLMFLQGPLEKDRWGLFTSTRAKIGAEWSKPAPLTMLNHPDAPRGDLSPSLSADGTKLFFASDRPGGKGGLDLWMVPTAQLGKK